MNIGTDQETTILELASLMKTIGGFGSSIECVPYETVFGASYEDIPRRVPDLARIHQIVGWNATTTLEEGLRLTIEYFRDQARRIV